LPRSSGFTLLELMLAIAISAVIIATVNFAFFQSHANIESVRRQRESTRSPASFGPHIRDLSRAPTCPRTTAR
jgi:prepilin-type N-terminal cleavage/methylation domain-containing protein